MKKAVLKFLGILFWAFWCVAALAVGTAWGWVRTSPVLEEFVRQKVRNEKPEAAFANTDQLTLLLLGCDETRDPRTKQILKKNARSDMMLVARLDFKRNRITGISIPRDLEASHPVHGTHKINAFHDLGGPDASQEVVESILPVRIDRTVVLDYDAFKRLIDAVGGVSVFIEKPLKYTDTWGDLYIDLKPGKQRLNGEQAMGYVRIRKVDSDFGRQERQRGFLVSLKNSIAANPAALGQVANETVALLGNSLTAREVTATMIFAQSVGADNIKMGMLPIKERRSSSNLDIDYDKLDETLAELGFIPRTL